MEIFHIDEDIRKSDTLPSFFYRERAWFDRSIAEIWEKCWIFIGDNTHQAPAGTLTPFPQIRTGRYIVYRTFARIGVNWWFLPPVPDSGYFVVVIMDGVSD
jgi:hypothetical protein